MMLEFYAAYYFHFMVRWQQQRLDTGAGLDFLAQNRQWDNDAEEMAFEDPSHDTMA